jgi:hypothetical protein
MRRRRRVAECDSDDVVVTIVRPVRKLVAFPSPNGEIRRMCREHLRRSVMVGERHRVLVDED